MRTRLALRKNRARVGLDRDHLHGRLLRLEVLAHARERTTRTDAGDEHVDRAIGVRPDLRTRRRRMALRVRRILELLENHRARCGIAQSLGLGDRALHALAAGRENDLGAIGGCELAALNGHGLGHGEDEVVALHGGDKREAHARIAARRLDDRRTRLEGTGLLGLFDHRHRNTVLHTATRIEELNLHQHAGTALVQLVGDLHERSAANLFQNATVDLTHLRTSLYCLPLW